MFLYFFFYSKFYQFLLYTKMIDFLNDLLLIEFVWLFYLPRQTETLSLISDFWFMRKKLKIYSIIC